MKDETIKNGMSFILAVIVCVLAIGFLVVYNGTGMPFINDTQKRVESKELVAYGDAILNEHILTGSEVIFDMEQAYKNGYQIKINSNPISDSYLKKGQEDASIYDNPPFNIVLNVNYTKQYLYDTSNDNIIGVNYLTY